MIYKIHMKKPDRLDDEIYYEWSKSRAYELFYLHVKARRTVSEIILYKLGLFGYKYINIGVPKNYNREPFK